jgi:hypothetical protein
MSYDGPLERKIDKLENKAKEIEKMMIDLIEKSKLLPWSYQIASGGAWNEEGDVFFTEKIFDKPRAELAELKIDLIRLYSEWYQQALVLIKRFCPYQEKEFREYYEGKTYDVNEGILRIIELNAHFSSNITKEDIIQTLISYFLRQRAMINAIPEMLPFYPSKVETSRETIPQKENPPVVVNVTQTQVQLQEQTSNITVRQEFERLRKVIDDAEITKDKKKALMDNIDDLEKTRGTKNYLENYTRFISSVADHITLISPFIPFLTSFL